jgi:hypothetical protein
MVTKRRWVTLHKVNGQFEKWTSINNRVKQGWWGPFLRGGKLIVSTTFNFLDTISEESRLEIASTHDFLGSVHPRKVTTKSIVVIRNQDLLYFIMCKTNTQ